MLLILHLLQAICIIYMRGGCSVEESCLADRALIMMIVVVSTMVTTPSSLVYREALKD